MGVSEAKICREDGHGLFLPLGRDWENSLPEAFRAILYMIGLGYCFLGVAIIADVFMSSIEKITSKRLHVHNPETKKTETKLVWNATVSNLTLMALGSSAPEILLSVIELLSNNFFSGDLGPSTIVGSAAFNLFVIIAVCIGAIPDGEVKRIKEVPVFVVTASFSIFAYVWLAFILLVASPHIVEIWEGVLTFMFFPLLVSLAYLADQGYFSVSPETMHELTRTFTTSYGGGGSESGLRGTVRNFEMGGSNMSKESLAALTRKIENELDEPLGEDLLVDMIVADSIKKNRATYKVQAVRAMTAGRRVNVPTVHEERRRTPSQLRKVVPLELLEDELIEPEDMQWVRVHFVAQRYAVTEGCKTVTLPVKLTGKASKRVLVHYQTREGDAKAGADFVAISGDLVFLPGETEKNIVVEIVDDKAPEPNEDFFVDLSLLEDCENVEVGDFVTVTIIDDDHPGILRFKLDELEVIQTSADQELNVAIERVKGSSGLISCKYKTEDDTAVGGRDYVSVEGELEFAEGQLEAVIPLTIKPSGLYEGTEYFRLVLHSCTPDGVTCDEKCEGGPETCVLTVSIKPDERAQDRIDRMMSKLQVNWDKTILGHHNWKEQFLDAVCVNGRESDSEPSSKDWVVHVVMLPWKVFFALVPPTDYCGGWLSFWCALVFIGFVTAIISDMASLLGCVIECPDEITAITFVALGTSLPDTFASKNAAQQDLYADASIGNVTGSNSVNVFLGLGLPWMIGAVYWVVEGADDDWREEYSGESFIEGFEGGAFVVKAGNLAFSVNVFAVCAVIAMAVLFVRRQLYGGELGGPRAAKYISSSMFVGLWLIYICLSIWYTLAEAE